MESVGKMRWLVCLSFCLDDYYSRLLARRRGPETGYVEKGGRLVMIRMIEVPGVWVAGDVEESGAGDWVCLAPSGRMSLRWDKKIRLVGWLNSMMSLVLSRGCSCVFRFV